MPDPMKQEMLGPIADPEMPEPDDNEQEPEETQGMLPDKPDDAEPPDTETETGEEKPSPDTETETDEEEPSADAELLSEFGLDKKYKSVGEALRSIPERDTYVGRIENSERELRKLLQQVAVERTQGQQGNRDERLSREDLAELWESDPDRALREMGYVHKEDVQRIEQKLQTFEQQRAVDTIVGATERLDGLEDVAKHMRARGEPPQPGSNALWDRMDSIFQQRPALQHIPQHEAIELCYDIAKTQMAQERKPDVDPVSQKKKLGASTTSRSSGRGKAKGDVPDFSNMTEKQIYAWYKERDLID